MRAFLVSLSLVTFSTTLCGVALAAEPPPTTAAPAGATNNPGAPTPAPSESPAAGAPTENGATAPTTTPPAPEPPPPAPVDRTDEPHVRWGFSPSAGLFFGSNPRALAFGLEARVGYQFNSKLGVYGMGGFAGGLGIGASSDSGGASAGISGVSYWFLGANAEALLADPLFVAGGLGIGKSSWGSASASTNNAQSTATTEVIAAGGITPQANIRVGLGLGKREKATGKKGSFTVALDLRVLWALDSVKETVTGGPNGVTAKSDTAAFGFAPMLMLGYDLR